MHHSPGSLQFLRSLLSLRPCGLGVVPRILRVRPALASIKRIVHRLLLSEFLTWLEDLLHGFNVFNDNVERVRNGTDKLVPVVFPTMCPYSVHERGVDLLKLLERAARRTADELAMELHQ